MQHKKTNGPNPKQSKMILEALALHQSGQLDMAETKYRKLLNFLPSNTVLLNNVGLIAFQKGKLQEALKIIEKSLQVNPNQPISFNNLGNVLKGLKRLDEALISYDRAIDLKPDYADAYFNRGNTLQSLKRLDEALTSFGDAIAFKTDFVDAYINRGNTLKDLKRLDEALTSYDCAIALKSDCIEAYYNRGIALTYLKQLDEALASYDRAIVLKPDYADAYSNRGNVLKDLKRLDEALTSCGQAIALNPDFSDAYFNRGNILQELNQFNEALASYDCAIVLKPNYAQAYLNRGSTLKGLKLLAEALVSYDHAIVIKPDYADAYFNRGNALLDLKLLDEALVSYNHAIAFNPDIDFIFGYSLHTKMHLCKWDDLTNLLNELIHRTKNDEKVTSPFALLALIDDPEIQKKAAQIYIKDKYPQDFSLGELVKGPRKDKLRLGYFSTDFKTHPVSFLMAGVFEHHDKSQFEVFAFSYDNTAKDEMRSRLESAFDQFIDVSGKSNQEVAVLCRGLGIDIAIDLGGHTADSRTGIFAFRVAPLQINYIGYPGTMGADYIDYIIADKTLIPETEQHYYSEDIIYLPFFQANDDKRSISSRHFTCQALGLPEVGFVFCCFNNPYKINPHTFDCWMRIIQQVEGSVLWLYAGNKITIDNLRKEAELRGVSRDRLVFAEGIPMPDYLARYQMADLFLDTLPFNGGTTASDALWAGLPLLTCAGEAFASRMAASLLTTLKLPELITDNQAAYETLAIELATHPTKLAAIKAKLAENKLTTIAFDTPFFTQQLEAAYTERYNKYYNT